MIPRTRALVRTRLGSTGCRHSSTSQDQIRRGPGRPRKYPQVKKHPLMTGKIPFENLPEWMINPTSSQGANDEQSQVFKSLSESTITPGERETLTRLLRSIEANRVEKSGEKTVEGESRTVDGGQDGFKSGLLGVAASAGSRKSTKSTSPTAQTVIQLLVEDAKLGLRTSQTEGEVPEQVPDSSDSTDGSLVKILNSIGKAQSDMAIWQILESHNLIPCSDTTSIQARYAARALAAAHSTLRTRFPTSNLADSLMGVISRLEPIQALTAASTGLFNSAITHAWDRRADPAEIVRIWAWAESAAVPVNTATIDQFTTITQQFSIWERKAADKHMPTTTPTTPTPTTTPKTDPTLLTTFLSSPMSIGNQSVKTSPSPTGIDAKFKSDQPRPQSTTAIPIHRPIQHSIPNLKLELDVESNALARDSMFSSPPDSIQTAKPDSKQSNVVHPTISKSVKLINSNPGRNADSYARARDHVRRLGPRCKSVLIRQAIGESGSGAGWLDNLDTRRA